MTVKLGQLLVPVLSFSFLVGCRDGNPQTYSDDIPPPAPPGQRAEPLPADDLVQPRDTVSVEYTGRLEATGEVFDSSEGREPLTFRVGAGQMIKGFDRGVVGMKVGESKTLTIPPEEGYGVEGRPPKIPPNSTLIFEVKLVDLKKAGR